MQFFDSAFIVLGKFIPTADIEQYDDKETLVINHVSILHKKCSSTCKIQMYNTHDNDSTVQLVEYKYLPLDLQLILQLDDTFTNINNLEYIWMYIEIRNNLQMYNNHIIKLVHIINIPYY